MGLIFPTTKKLDVAGVDMDELAMLSITTCLRSPLPTVTKSTVIHVDVLESYSKANRTILSFYNGSHRRLMMEMQVLRKRRHQLSDARVEKSGRDFRVYECHALREFLETTAASSVRVSVRLGKSVLPLAVQNLHNCVPRLCIKCSWRVSLAM
jgi:hypothetical protein